MPPAGRPLPGRRESEQASRLPGLKGSRRRRNGFDWRLPRPCRTGSRAAMALLNVTGCHSARESKGGRRVPSKKKPRSREARAGQGENSSPGWLKVDLRAELQDARIKGGVELAEGGVDAAKFRVVPGVERFQTEFEAAATRLAQAKALEERDVPVVHAGAAKSIVAQSTPGAQRREGKGAGVDVLDDLSLRGANRMLVRNRAGQIRPIGAPDKVAALIAAKAKVQRQTGLHRDDAGHLPTADRAAHEAALAVPEHRYVIDEVDDGHVAAIVAAGAIVIDPSGVGIGNAAQVATAAARCRWINGFRQGVHGAQRQVPANL